MGTATPRLEFACRRRYPDGFQLDAEFTLGDGVTALVGPSGSGKTTALNLIAGLLHPDAGRIVLDGRVLTDVEQRIFVPPHRRPVGVVFQDYLLFPHINVRDNLTYGLRRRAPRSGELPHVVELLELAELLDRRPHTLSGGERQRVALGRAILSGPKLLLLDEPLSAIDEALRRRILTFIERVIQEFRIPTVFISHNQEDVKRLADRVILFESGRCAEEANDTPPPLDRRDEAIRERPQ